MNKKYSVVLFDMDGTIANTDEMILQTFHYLYDKYRNGNRRKDEEIYYFSGPPIKETLQKEFPELDQKKLLDEYHQVSRSLYEKTITAYPHCKEILLKLKKDNFILGVVTNKMYVLTEYVLKILDLENIFTFIVGAEDVNKGKPDPEGMKKAILLSKEKDIKKVVYVGDNAIDYITSEKVGIDSILVSWGPRKLTSDIKPTYKISSYLDLMEVLYGK